MKRNVRSFSPQVATNEAGLRGSWFTGTVLRMKGNHALVKYDELLTDDGE